MKTLTLFKLTVVFLLIMFLATIGYCYTYEGEFNPAEIAKWQVLNIGPTDYPSVAAVIVQNPDKTAEVQKILLFIHVEGFLLSYGYVKNGVNYVYAYDSILDKYKRYPPTEKI